MNRSLVPFLKFIAVTLLGGSATLTAATLVLGLGTPQARAHNQGVTAVTLSREAQHGHS
ncbi:hypothetical protein [Pseudophaeobacter arcticus]|uniref:hypothetical protein n=1 Tax=Pseudophaeobacter arcticus TaxID=385492 RepID=UPI0024926230|nr:hypothetical protein [Pseudophaeobacter arcticus]